MPTRGHKYRCIMFTDVHCHSGGKGAVLSVAGGARKDSATTFKISLADEHDGRMRAGSLR